MLPLFTDSYSCVDDFCLQNIIVNIYIFVENSPIFSVLTDLLMADLLAIEYYNDWSFWNIILNSILNHVEQDQLVLEPVCLNCHLGFIALPCYVHIDLSLLYHWNKWLNHFLNMVVNRLVLVELDFEFVLFYFHSLNLVLVVIPHYLTRIGDWVDDLDYLFVLTLLLICVSVLADFIEQFYNSMAGKLAIHQDAV